MERREENRYLLWTRYKAGKKAKKAENEGEEATEWGPKETRATRKRKSGFFAKLLKVKKERGNGGNC